MSIPSFQDEPLAYTAIVSTVIALAVVCGLSIPVGFTAALIAVINSVAALFARQQVRPVATSVDVDELNQYAAAAAQVPTDVSTGPAGATGAAG
jgi:hypothetical protein